jgi:hypothetical protein
LARLFDHPHLAEIANVLQRQLPALEAAFAPARVEDTVRALRQLGEARAQRLFGWPAGDRATGDL